MYPDLTAVVEVKVPELGVLEGDALDRDVLGVLDEAEPGPGNAQFLKLFRSRRGISQFPELVPDRQPRPIQDAFAADVQPVAAFGVDQGRIEMLLEVSFDAGACSGKFFISVEHLSTASFSR